MASRALLAALLLVAAASASAFNLPSGSGTGFCPVITDNWALGGVSNGLIFNTNNAYLGKVEDATITSVAACAAKCASTPKCVFYSYLNFLGDLVSDCFMFSCGACTDGASFNPNEVVSQLVGGLLGITKTYTYKSGAVPSALATCTGVKGDPHFSGADNSHFEFTGVPNTTYAMLSDAHVHMNMHLGGRYAQWGDESALRPLTWIRQVGILWGEHTMTFKAREGPAWQYEGGYMADIQVDGRPVALRAEGETASFANGRIAITWVAAQLKDSDDEIDVYAVKVADVLSLRLKLRPEVAHLRTPTDGVVHFSVELPQVILSQAAHGVLGQTYRGDHRGRLAKQNLVYSKLLGTEVVAAQNGKGFLDGEPDDYAVSGLLSTDCKMSRFAHATRLDSETSKAIEISSGDAGSKYMLPEQVLSTAAQSFRKLLRK